MKYLKFLVCSLFCALMIYGIVQYRMPSPKGNLEKARDFVDLQDYAQAMVFYKKQLEFEPNNPNLLIEVARVSNFLDNHTEARDLLLKTLKVAPKRRFDVLRPLGWQYIALKKPEIAINYFKEYLSKYPKDTPALNGLMAATSDEQQKNLFIARDFFDKKNYNTALLYYQKQLELEPNNSELLFEIAKAYDTVGKFEESKKLLSKALVIAPQRRIYFIHLLAWQYLKLNRPDLAKPLFEEYLKVFPDDMNAQKGLERSNANLKINKK